LNLVSTLNCQFILELVKTGVKAVKSSINTDNASTIGNLKANHWQIVKLALTGLTTTSQNLPLASLLFSSTHIDRKWFSA